MGDVQNGVRRQRVNRRITIGSDEWLRTAAERISLLIPEDLVTEETAPLTLQKKCDDAFDVEAVTRAFYKGYEEVFDNL